MTNIAEETKHRPTDKLDDVDALATEDAATLKTSEANVRMNAAVVDALNNRGTVRLNLSVSATIDGQPADLSRGSVRLLMENAALANALREGQPVENL